MLALAKAGDLILHAGTKTWKFLDKGVVQLIVTFGVRKIFT